MSEYPKHYAAHVCGAKKDYFYGDLPPPKEAGFFEFMEWSVAQQRKRRRKEAKR